MTYARARLLLGISGVGTIVLISLASLCLDLPTHYLAGAPALLGIGITLLCYIVISFPFDLFGGYLLPLWHRRTSVAFPSFLASWLRGVLSQAVLMGLAGLALLQSARLAGTGGSVACLAVLMLLLLLFQAGVARIVGGFSCVRTDFSGMSDALKRWNFSLPEEIAYVSSDLSFVGGIVGWPGRERLIIPVFWLTELPREQTAIELGRRAGVLATGSRTRGLALALLWNLAGFALAAHLSASGLGQAAGLVTAALWFTIWSFFGLLILPSLSRPGVFESDHFVKDRGVTASALSETITNLDRMQDDEPVRARWIERIFHPVPSVASRIQNLQSQNRPHGAWQGARVALYLSWACFGFLSRAVHCNCGRPELWVLFPGD